MAQQINDNFSLLAGIPIEQDMQKSTIGGRDAIKTTKRWLGMTCYVIQTNTTYQLQGGIANDNWVGIAGSNVASEFEVSIDGFLAFSSGKTTLDSWEVGDKFRGWIGSRYLVGEILSLPVSLPSDIDNTSKVKLAIDSNSLNNVFPKLQITATAGQTVFPLGTTALAKMAFRNGFPLDDSDWSQTGANATTTFPFDLNDIFKII